MIWKSAEYNGWGRVLKAQGDQARPERQSALLALPAAAAIGNCRSYGDACLNGAGKAIQMTRLDRILGFDEAEGSLHVEAGITVGEIARIYAPRGWLPSVMPGTGFATVGGCIANDVHGKNHHHAGSFGQFVDEITLLQNGKSRKVTPDKTPDLFKATVGGLGQTGIIVSARLRLLSCKGDLMTVTERRAENLEEFLSLFDSSRATYSVGWIDATAKGGALGRGILEEGETGYGLVPPPKRSKSIPIDAPGFALSSPVVRIFNHAYFHRVPEPGRTLVKPINDFFFPLDKIHAWNRLYGKRGFHQFQCVVPLDAVDTLREMLEKIAHSGLASPLAVLKRMGPGRAGYMSFPMEGYTLAVDFPNRGPVASLIARLEEMTAAAGGRIYLAKDALATAKRLQGMYPEQPKFAAAAAKADPEGHLTTDLVRRLKLRTLK